MKGVNGYAKARIYGAESNSESEITQVAITALLMANENDPRWKKIYYFPSRILCMENNNEEVGCET